MSKIFDFIWLLFISVEIFIIFVAFCYLRREYDKAVKEYNESKREIRTYIIEKKDTALKSIVKMNMTEIIDVQEINRQLYVQLIFFKKGKYIGNKEIPNKKIRIGRDQRSDVVIKDRSVSRKQCQIVKEGDIFILKNYSQANTTTLNGEIVTKSTEIKYGDVVGIGNIAFTFDSVMETDQVV